MDEGEPTKAADVGATAEAPESTDGDTSLIDTSAVEKQELACSAAETAEVTPQQRRSWRVPVTLAAAALLATCSVVGYHMWPRHHAATAPPSPAHAPPAAQDDPDARFMALYKSRGYIGDEDQDVLKAAHQMRDDLSAGLSKGDVIRDLQNVNPQMKPGAAALLVNTVVDAYHPQISQDPDRRYVALYRSRGGAIVPGHEHAAANEARQVCERLSSGESFGQLVTDIVVDNPGMTRYNASLFANTAADVFCPQYSQN